MALFNINIHLHGVKLDGPETKELLTLINQKLNTMAKTVEEFAQELQDLQTSVDATQERVATGFQKLEDLIQQLKNNGGANADQLQVFSDKVAEIKADVLSTPVAEPPVS